MAETEKAKLSVRVRAATAKNAEEMISMVNRAFAVEDFLDGTRTDPERMAEARKKGEFQVAESGESIVACVYVELRGKRGYFGMLGVDPAWPGKGLGRILTEAAAEDYCRARGCTDMDITVLSLRREVLPFYRKLGYVETRTEESHPSVPLKAGFECHSIVLSKKL